jgi:S1-C subfamily serine protease
MKTIIYLTIAFVVRLLATECLAQQKTYSSAQDDTVLAISFQGADNTVSQGSCSVIEPSLVLTAGHVVGGSEALVRYKSDAVRGRVIALDLYHDLALVRLEKELDCRPRPVRKTKLETGEKIWIIGYGRGYGFTLGRVAGNALRGRSVPGDSGGAIVDSKGSIIGVVQGYSDDGYVYGHGRDVLVDFIEKNKGNDPLKLGGKNE